MGGGAWGTTVAATLASSVDTVLWARTLEVKRDRAARVTRDTSGRKYYSLR
jgi:glycerol-3-phosphate dehydrogenase